MFYKKRREEDELEENIDVESKPETTPATETTVKSQQSQFSPGLQFQASLGPRLQEKMSEKCLGRKTERKPRE